MSWYMPVQIEKAAWGGWPNCYRISNGEVELIVTSDIGPRIMRFGFISGGNVFKVYEEHLGKSGEPTWQFRGGHRVWLAPEDRQMSYAADNFPVEVELSGDVLTLTAPVEPESGLRKQMSIRMDETGSGWKSSTGCRTAVRQTSRVPFGYFPSWLRAASRLRASLPAPAMLMSSLLQIPS